MRRSRWPPLPLRLLLTIPPPTRCGIVPAASKGGKIKTVLQTVALVLMLLPLGQLGLGWLIPGWVLMGAVTAITVWTGLVYVRDAYILRRNWLQAQASQGGGM